MGQLNTTTYLASVYAYMLEEEVEVAALETDSLIRICKCLRNCSRHMNMQYCAFGLRNTQRLLWIGGRSGFWTYETLSTPSTECVVTSVPSTRAKSRVLAWAVCQINN